jgi:hypothetical protein
VVRFKWSLAAELILRTGLGEQSVHQDPEPEADGIDRLEPDRDTEWETEEEEESLVQIKSRI